MAVLLPSRFMSKVEVQPNGCHLWTGAKITGYGVFRLNGKNVYAHRYAWEQEHGPVPGGHELDHLCHTRDSSCMGGFACPHRACVLLDHLEPVPHEVNMGRGHWARARACSHGHSWTPDNTSYLIKTNGRAQRVCLACTVRRQREYQARRAS